jgi:hypothetical protein
MDGDDLRSLPLSIRKAKLARLLARRPDGIFLSDFEQGEIGAACQLGSEKAPRPSIAIDRTRRPVKDWIKVKNRKHPAIDRVMDRLG